MRTLSYLSFNSYPGVGHIVGAQEKLCVYIEGDGVQASFLGKEAEAWVDVQRCQGQFWVHCGFEHWLPQPPQAKNPQVDLEVETNGQPFFTRSFHSGVQEMESCLDIFNKETLVQNEKDLGFIQTFWAPNEVKKKKVNLFSLLLCLRIQFLSQCCSSCYWYPGHNSQHPPLYTESSLP